MAEESVLLEEATPKFDKEPAFVDTEGMNLAQKIASALLEVGGGGPPLGWNNDKGYTYFTAAQTQRTVLQALAKRGVIVIPQIVAHDLELVTISGDRGDRTRYDSRIDMVMTLTDGYETYTAPWVGRGSDWTAPDKGFYGAITSGHKYWLLKLLGIASDEDDIEHAPGEEGAVTGPRRTVSTPVGANDLPLCPLCKGKVWDNRPKKASGEYSAKAPDFKCKDKTCGGVIWDALQLEPGHSLDPSKGSEQTPDLSNTVAQVANLLKLLYGDKSTKMAHEFAMWASGDRTGKLEELNLGEAQMCQAELEQRYTKRANAALTPAATAPA